MQKINSPLTSPGSSRSDWNWSAFHPVRPFFIIFLSVMLSTKCVPFLYQMPIVSSIKMLVQLTFNETGKSILWRAM